MGADGAPEDIQLNDSFSLMSQTEDQVNDGIKISLTQPIHSEAASIAKKHVISTPTCSERSVRTSIKRKVRSSLAEDSSSDDNINENIVAPTNDVVVTDLWIQTAKSDHNNYNFKSHENVRDMGISYNPDPTELKILLNNAKEYSKKRSSRKRLPYMRAPRILDYEHEVYCNTDDNTEVLNRDDPTKTDEVSCTEESIENNEHKREELNKKSSTKRRTIYKTKSEISKNKKKLQCMRQAALKEQRLLRRKQMACIDQIAEEIFKKSNNSTTKYMKSKRNIHELNTPNERSFSASDCRQFLTTLPKSSERLTLASVSANVSNPLNEFIANMASKKLIDIKLSKSKPLKKKNAIHRRSRYKMETMYRYRDLNVN